MTFKQSKRRGLRKSAVSPSALGVMVLVFSVALATSCAAGNTHESTIDRNLACKRVIRPLGAQDKCQPSCVSRYAFFCREAQDACSLRECWSDCCLLIYKQTVGKGSTSDDARQYLFVTESLHDRQETLLGRCQRFCTATYMHRESHLCRCLVTISLHGQTSMNKPYLVLSNLIDMLTILA